MRVAVFDLDGTILDGNSFQAWVRHISVAEPVRLPGFLVRFAAARCGILPAWSWRISTLRRLRGWSREEVSREGEKIWEQRLRDKVRPSARLEWLRRRELGYRCAIATGAWDFLAAPLAQEWQADALVASALAWDGERCLGCLAGAPTVGKAKLAAIEGALGPQVDWAASAAWSDEASDLPLLERVGEPVVVTDEFPPWAATLGARIERW